MKRLIKCKLAYIVLLSIVLFSLNPAPVHAWSAVTVELESDFPLVRLWNFFRDIVSSFTGKESPQVTLSDKGTHQLMMKLAYQLLEKDPAYIDQKEYFPAIKGILEWEGAVAKTDRAILEGGEWRGRDVKRGGPDAAGKSKDSFHYYNPRTGKGSADIAVETCFKELLLQMYGQGDFFSRDKPDDDTNHNAAWAAHYLGDVYVPYHTVGVFTNDLSAGILSAQEAGPEFLFSPYECKLTNGGINCDSMDKPLEWNGLNNDFTDIYSYFKRYRSNPDKDWFDPWYYNGVKGLGPNTVLGSHQWWESWAHGDIVDGNLAKAPASYSKDWKNATPEFNKSLAHIENQSVQAKQFTLAAVNNDTKNNMEKYSKTPVVAFNKAAERVATLWRASITALRPEINVAADAANPKLLKVTATIKSVEPGDPAIKVKAKLTVDGGAIRGDAVHEADKSGKTATGKPVPGSTAATSQTNRVEITPGHPWVTEWQVDSSDPDKCEFKLEAICEYQKTPDLQYAVCTYARPLSVTVTPSQTEPKGKVTLTARVSPPQQTELDIKVKPPQKDEVDLKDWGSARAGWGKVSTDINGEYKADFTVKDGTATGSYQITITAPKLHQKGTASLNVGKLDLSWVKKFRFRLETGSHKDKYFGIKIDQTFEGGFTGNTFTGTLRPRDGYNGTGDVTITVIPTDIPAYYRVTGFSLHVNIEKVVKDTKLTRIYSQTCTLAGDVPAGSGEIPIGDKVPINDYGAWMKPAFGGQEVCNYIKEASSINKTQDATRTTTDGVYRPVCNEVSYIYMGFAKD